MTTEEQLVYDLSNVARKYLKNTDWLVIRNVEKGTVVPAAITAKREECILYLTTNSMKEVHDIIFYAEPNLEQALQNLLDYENNFLEIDFVAGTFSKIAV